MPARIPAKNKLVKTSMAVKLNSHDLWAWRENAAMAYPIIAVSSCRALHDFELASRDFNYAYRRHCLLVVSRGRLGLR